MNLISKKSDDNNIVNHKFKKLDFLNDEKTEESITIINEDNLELFKENKKNKRKGKDKEYNDLKKDLNIKIFKHFDGEKNDKFEEEKKIEMNNTIKNEFLFKRQETNSKTKQKLKINYYFICIMEVIKKIY